MQSWRGNMTQQRQHAVLQLDITLRLAQRYHQKTPPETGGKLKYYIQALRKEPRKLEQWIKQKETENKPDMQREELKGKIQQGLQQ